MNSIFLQSTESRQISAAFYSYRNDIEIYTEDEPDDRQFYVRLLSRLMDGTGIRINDVHPLGSCTNVETAHNADVSLKGKLYITDGDIFAMFAPKASSLHKYVLDAYCIENFVIDEDSLSQYLYEHIGTIDIAECVNRLKYSSRISSVRDAFLNLFRHYAVEKKLLDVFAMSSVLKFYDEKHLQIRNGDINNEIIKIKQELKAHGFSEEVINKECSKMAQTCPCSDESFGRYLSGKDWLMPYFLSIITSLLPNKMKPSKIPFKFQLAKNCKLNRLQGLRQAIINVVNDAKAAS